MSVLDFPAEILEVVLETCVVVNGLEEALRLRLVCRRFNAGVVRGICTTRALEGPNSKLPVGQRLWTEYLISLVQSDRAAENPFAETVRGAIDFIIAEKPEDEPRRSEYLRILCLAVYQKGMSDRQKFEPYVVLSVLRTPADDSPRTYQMRDNLLLSKEALAMKTSLKAALAASACLGILPLFKKLLEQGVNTQHSNFGNVLDIAAARGDVEMVRLLLEQEDAKLKEPGERFLDMVFFAWSRRDAIAKAAENGQRVVLEMLLEPNITPGILGNVHEFWTYLTAIQAAAAGGQLEVLNFLMEKASARGVLDTIYDEAISHSSQFQHIPEREEVQLQILKTAASHGREHILRHFLDNGADPNARRLAVSRGRNSTTLLGRAARGGHEGAVRLLLERGADPNRYNDSIPLVQAVRGGWLKVAEILIDAGAEVNSKDKWLQQSPLEAALQCEQTECAKMLLEHGAKAL